MTQNKNQQKHADTTSDRSDTSDSRSIPNDDSSSSMGNNYNNTLTKSQSKLVDDFYDKAKMDLQSLQDNTLEESPCYTIIGKRGQLYFCRLHPKDMTTKLVVYVVIVLMMATAAAYFIEFSEELEGDILADISKKMHLKTTSPQTQKKLK
jgi:hypothetical protein